MFTTNPYYRALFIFILALIPFTLTRIALHIVYSADFQDLGFWQILISYVHGIRFDAAMIALYIGFPLVFMMLPMEWAKSRLWQNIWAWFIFFVLLFFVFTLIGDLMYFEIVHRHAGPEVFFILTDIPLMVDVAVSEHLYALIAFFVVGLLAAEIWHKSFRSPIVNNSSKLKSGLFVFVIFLGLIIVGRGGLQLKPLKISDAFISAEPSAAYLTINGTFAITQAMRSTKPSSEKYMPDEEAIRITQNYVKGDNETFIDKNYPLMRKVTHSEPSTSPNIVFLLIESLDAIHFDRMRRLNNLEALGSTPNLDKLSEEGLLFTNFYSTGQRSIDGIAATIASIPTLPGFPYLGQGLEQNRLSFLGNIAKEQGYSTIFTRSASRGSFHVDSVSAQAGFDEYYGAEDIPSTHKDQKNHSKWGVWDHDTFEFTLDKLETIKKPFLGYVFTSTTHTPWRIPNDEWKLHKGKDKRTKYLNSLYYADWAIGDFMANIKKTKYYKNTIFVITGDHISRFAINPDDIKTRFQIPLIIIGPGIKPGINTQIGNQMDVLPTIIDLAKWETTHSSLGVSLMRDKPKHFSFSVNGEMINYIDNDMKFAFNPRHQSTMTIKNQEEVKNQQNTTLAIQQTVINLLLRNRWFRQ